MAYFLNALYTMFDSVTDKYNIFNVLNKGIQKKSKMFNSFRSSIDKVHCSDTVKIIHVRANLVQEFWRHIKINSWEIFKNNFLPAKMILGSKRNSKLPKVKWNLQPYWKAGGGAGGTQAENSAIFWLNWLCVSGAISMLAQDFISLLVILSSFYIPKT